MEALTAIGLIANIVQFVDLGAKLIGSAKEIHDSTSGMTMENKSLEEVTIEMRDLTWRLKLPITDSNSQDQQALRRLAQECRELSEQILHLLKKIAPGKPNSTLGTLRSAIKNIKYNDEKKELEERLAHCRSQLHLQFSKLTSLMPLRKTLDALIALLKNKAVQESYRFCFFIDALDEFEDTAQHDDSYLVDALRFWVQTSPNIIKLCVSSREHNVFVNAFADGPRIRLQELTRHDMECFTRSKLGSIPEAATLERLTQDIVNRSDGIFLWVVLVIKELRRALEDGRDTSSFKEELATLPTELEELFEHLLGSIQKSQRKKAYQIFAMVQKAETLPGGLSLLSCLYLDEYQAGGQFATKEPPVLTQLDTQNEFDPHTWYKTQTQKARRLLQACCRGLVEDRPTPEVINEKSVLWEGGTKHREKYEEDEKDRARREKYGGVALRPKSSWYTRPETYPNPSKPAGSRYVVFVHRTIVEFLERPAVVETTAEQLVGFDVIEAISQMHLAEYEATPCSLIEPLYWSYLYGNLMELRFRAGKDRSHFEFLVELESTVSRKFPGWLENKLPPSKEYILRVVHQGFAAGLVAQPTSCYSDSEDWKNHVTVPITTPVSYSAFFGNASYILWRITRPHKPPLSDQLVGIVLHCLSQSQLIVLFLERDEAKGVHTTEILIESKLISEDSPRKPVAMWVNIQDDHVLMTKLLAPPKEGSAGHILGQNNKGYVSLGELVKLWNLENEAEILGLIAQARTAYPHMTSQSLQRIDSAIAIWRQEHPLSSYSSIITIANIPPTRLRAAKARSGRAIGITTVITLLGLSAFLIAHQDYWVRQSSIIVYEPARIATEAYHHVNLGKD
ncbi:uncharacterized protein J4E79_011236 [Alternaria viburni]|uniref:uncharacterized protein n=1 Tax=Alternaria viburni TaxID=566460 RepID=UPI0020C1BCB8|nr:uncharacterized protein J4E79_011236 [Alternaria viburni]KAI4643296.1 hypothetical protein J4E79_011236 [Alternaria viburni]